MQYPYPNYAGLYQSVLGLVFARMVERYSAVQLILPAVPANSEYDFEILRIPRWTRERPPRDDTTFDASRWCWTDGHEILWVCTIASENAVALQLRRQIARWRGIRVHAGRWRVDRDGEVRISVSYTVPITPNRSKEWETMLEYARQIGNASIQRDFREASISLDLTVDLLDISDATWPEDFI